MFGTAAICRGGHANFILSLLLGWDSASEAKNNGPSTITIMNRTPRWTSRWASRCGIHCGHGAWRTFWSEGSTIIINHCEFHILDQEVSEYGFVYSSKRWKPQFSVDSQLRTQLTKRLPRSSSKGNFFVRVRFGGFRVRLRRLSDYGSVAYLVEKPTRETWAEQYSDTVLLDVHPDVHLHVQFVMVIVLGLSLTEFKRKPSTRIFFWACLQMAIQIFGRATCIWGKFFFSLAVGAFLLTVELLCLQSVEVLIDTLSHCK